MKIICLTNKGEYYSNEEHTLLNILQDYLNVPYEEYHDIWEALANREQSKWKADFLTEDKYKMFCKSCPDISYEEYAEIVNNEIDQIVYNEEAKEILYAGIARELIDHIKIQQHLAEYEETKEQDDDLDP